MRVEDLSTTESGSSKTYYSEEPYKHKVNLFIGKATPPPEFSTFTWKTLSQPLPHSDNCSRLNLVLHINQSLKQRLYYASVAW